MLERKIHESPNGMSVATSNMSDFGRVVVREEVKEVPKAKDSVLLSIIFMSVFSLGSIGHATMFKVIIGGGMAMPDYFLFRNAFLWLCSIVEISIAGVHRLQTSQVIGHGL